MSYSLHHLQQRYQRNAIFFPTLTLLCLLFGFAPSALADSTHTPKTIAILQIVEHASLDKVHQGIIDELAANGYRDGKTAKIFFKNAQGNIVVATQIAHQFVIDQPDVIVAIATPSAQAAVNAARKTKIPIVFASVSDPIQAKLVHQLKHPGENITGTRNVSPIEKQLNFIQEITPGVKKIGIILNDGEANSVRLLQIATENAAHMNMKVISASASNSAEVRSATESVVTQVDALFLLQDNTVASALPVVLKVAAQHKIPVFSTYLDAVKLGALAGLAFDEYTIGRETGKIVTQILEGKKVGDISVMDPSDIQSAVNLNTAKTLNIKLNPIFIKKIDVVYS